MKKLFILMVTVMVLVGFTYAQSINVTSPNGGSFKQAQSITIVWASSGITGDVKINLRKADGTSGTTLFNAVPYNSSPKSYSLSTVDPGNYFIIVKQGQLKGQSQNFEVTEGGWVRPDWGRLKDMLRRIPEWWWGPGPGPGPDPCKSCPPMFDMTRIRELIKELGVKEELTVEIVRTGQVFSKAVIGENGRRIKGLRRMKVMPKLRVMKLQKFNNEKQLALKKGAGFKVVIKNAKGEVIAENGIKVRERLARR